MPQKIRKLVVAGPKDSGKTAWAAVFHRLIPPQSIATITKERQFSAAMIDETMQLVIIDDWCSTTMESDLAKTLLQGGWMTTAVKHQQPRCFFNSCPFYITTNEVPDFGKENENVQRRLAIFNTKSLDNVRVGADKWIYDNAMACVTWVAKQIEDNIDSIEVHERWYETNEPTAISNRPSLESCQYLPQITRADLLPSTLAEPSIASSPPEEIHASFSRAARRLVRNIERRRIQTPPSSRASEDEMSLVLDNLPNESESSRGTEREDDADSEDDRGRTLAPSESDESEGFDFQSPTQWTLNSQTYFKRMAGHITTRFYGSKLPAKPTLAFRARMDNAPRKEKDFLTKADPIIDTWFLICGMVRDVFDLEAFVIKYPEIDGPLAKLRESVRRQVLHDDCPVVKMKKKMNAPSSQVADGPTDPLEVVSPVETSTPTKGGRSGQLNIRRKAFTKRKR